MKLDCRRYKGIIFAICGAAMLLFTAGPLCAAQAQTTPGVSPSAKFLPGFKPFKIKTSTGITINGVIGGSGPPVLLLHGAPVNLAGWRKMAPALAKKYTVVATDLRGYGDSETAVDASGNVWRSIIRTR